MKARVKVGDRVRISRSHYYREIYAVVGEQKGSHGLDNLLFLDVGRADGPLAVKVWDVEVVS